VTSNILVIRLQGVAPDGLLGDERLTNVRWLMNAGCYGRLALAEDDWSAALDRALHEPLAATATVTNALQWLDVRAASDGHGHLDETIGRALMSLEDETAILVAAADTPGQNGAFILAAPDSPLQGEIQGAQLPDVAATLLALAGYELPDSLKGRSLAATQTQWRAPDDPLSNEEEQILLERLSGLGYV
jgi:hypothetical protein